MICWVCVEGLLKSPAETEGRISQVQDDGMGRFRSGDTGTSRLSLSRSLKLLTISKPNFPLLQIWDDHTATKRPSPHRTTHQAPVVRVTGECSVPFILTLAPPRLSIHHTCRCFPSILSTLSQVLRSPPTPNISSLSQLTVLNGWLLFPGLFKIMTASITFVSAAQGKVVHACSESSQQQRGWMFWCESSVTWGSLMRLQLRKESDKISNSEEYLK